MPSDLPGRSHDWRAPTAHEPLDALVPLPGSKSLTNRYLVLAALAGEPSRLRAPLRARDTLLMVDGLVTLGADVAEAGEDWVLTPGPLRGGGAVDCGLAGTVLRFLPPVAALASGPVRFDGDPRARERPLRPVLEALRSLGVALDDGGRGGLPFTVHGRGGVRGGTVVLDASASSQFVSALLLAGPRFEQGVTVRHDGPPIPSQPHLAMTVEVLRDVGVVVDDSRTDVWRVEPGAVRALDVRVEPDLSNAGPFLAAALVAGGSVTVPDWPHHTTQPGDRLRDILRAMGGEVVLARDGLVVTGSGTVAGIDVDLHDASELTPLVAALGALAVSPSRIRGVAHIRGHETDRLAALAAELTARGAEVSVTSDGLEITPHRLRGGRFRTYSDHRLATAAAVLGLRVRGVVVEDVGTTAKTLPGFADRWCGMLGPR